MLRGNGLEGVKAIVESLGGIWGKSQLEDKIDGLKKPYTERPNIPTRNPIHQFEELIGMKIGMEEFRAYILLRNSALNAEDKKRLSVASQSSLEYRDVVANLKLLGSRFFHEVHAGKQHNPRTKTYDTTALFTEEETTLLSTTPFPANEEF